MSDLHRSPSSKYFFFLIAMIGIIYFIYSMTAEKNSSRTGKAIDARDSTTIHQPEKKDTVRETIIPEQRMQILLSATPLTIAAGKTTDLVVTVLNEEKSPIANAAVMIESGEGSFVTSNKAIETGKTDERGVFMTKWKAPKPASTGYGLLVTVNKEGYYKAEKQLTVKIQ